jgi:hypothetical protein
MKKHTRSFLILLALIAGNLMGQLASNTSLVGNVTDAAGAAVSGAQVTALNQGTGETLTATTSELGYYDFSF